MVRLTKLSSGCYEYKILGHTFVITRNDERDTSWYGEWAIIDENNPWSGSDPIRTLAKCRLALEDMEKNPDQYGIKQR